MRMTTPRMTTLRTNRTASVMFSCILLSLLTGTLQAQSSTPAPKATPAPARAAVAPRVPMQADLAQLMRGTFYPASNVVFAAQNENPADVKLAPDPSVSVNLLTSSYGKWAAVENSALAIYEVASLLTVPGRKCSNGLIAPTARPDWPKFVQGLRDAAMVALKAAQAKDQDKILDAADVMTTACANCHNVYREKPSLADRCK